MNQVVTKTYSNTFIYGKKDSAGYNAEGALIDFIMKGERVAKDSTAFEYIKNEVKVRQTSAVLYKVMMRNDVMLVMHTKELPASFKVFYAKDIRTGKDAKVFIDVTGIFKLQNGYFVCKEIDRLCAYLIGALINLTYYQNPLSIVNNATISSTANVCFTKLFNGILDNLRVINFMENRTKIAYIAGVYFNYNLMGKELGRSQTISANVLSIDTKTAAAYDYYYDEADLEDIDKLISLLERTFKMKGLTTDVYVDKWSLLYGKGTMYGLELLPTFLQMITNAYSGAYINNQRMIETLCGRDMVNLATSIIRAGADIYSENAVLTPEMIEEAEAWLERKKNPHFEEVKKAASVNI